MKRTLNPAIDDNYQAKAQSAKTILEYHSNVKKASRILMSAQVVYPVLTFIVAAVVVTYYYFFGDEREGIAYQKRMKPEKIAKLMVILILSTIFSLFTFGMSIQAVREEQHYLDDNVKMWYKDTDTTAQIRSLYWVPITMVIENAFIIFLFFTLIITIALIACRHSGKPQTCGNFCQSHCLCDPPTHNSRNLWVGLCVYSIVFPLTNVAIHANHIIIAFIHNKEHAISMTIVYGILIFINRQVIVLCTKEWFGEEIELITKGPEKFIAGGVNCGNCNDNRKRVCNLFLFYLLMLAVTAVINLFFVYVATIFVIVPINDAIDEAPARLQSIYSTSLIAALIGISYFLFFKKSEPREVKITKEQLTTLIPPKVGQNATLSQEEVTANHIPQNGDLTQEQQDKVIKLIGNKRLREHIPQ